jgi:DNA end-binding protein Ku
LHQLYYANEGRSFNEIDTGAKLGFSDKERDLAEKLIEQLSSDEFEAEKYTDTFSDRVKTAVEQKVAGQEVTIAPEAPKAQIIDLFEALKKSLAEKPAPPPAIKGGPKKAEPEEKAEPKKGRARKG